MAEEDTESLELVPIEVWNSREALDVNIVNLEEGKLRHTLADREHCIPPAFRALRLGTPTTLSHAEGQDRESSTNENSDGTGSAAAVSAAGNITDNEKCVCYVQPVSPTHSLLVRLDRVTAPLLDCSCPLTPHCIHSG